MKTLSDWIAELEAEEFPKPLDRRIATRLRADFPACSVRSSSSDPLPFCSYAERMLQKLWSDVSFWRFQKRAPAGEENVKYIMKNFGLHLPPFSHEVWFEAARDENGRKRLFTVLNFRPGTLPEVRCGDAEALSEIHRYDRWITSLFLDYV